MLGMALGALLTHIRHKAQTARIVQELEAKLGFKAEGEKHEKTASARAFACWLERSKSSAESCWVNLATVSLHSRNRPSPIFGGGQLRKLRNIIHSPKRESGCRVRWCRVPDGTAGRRGRGAISATRHHLNSQRNILAMQCVSRLVPMCSHTGSNSYRA